MWRSFNRGGNWNNGANAGVFYSNGNNPRSNSNANIGFRSALPHRQMCNAHGLCSRTRVSKGAWLLGQMMSEVIWKKNTKAA